MCSLWVFPRARRIICINVFGLIGLYKTGTSTISQEAFSILEALLCIWIVMIV